MSLKNSALVLSFAAAMALLSNATYAIDMSSSQIIKTTGKVSVKKTTSPEFKKLNTNLKLSGSLKNLDGGDKVRTFNNSTADLALKDTCILMVKEQSIFEIPKVLNQKDLINLQAQQGSILFKVAHGSNFQVQTADVICGVKGTMFSVTIVDGLNALLETPGLQLGYAYDSGTVIEVYEGEVEVVDKTSKKKTNLKGGQLGAFLTSINQKAKYVEKIVNFDVKKTLLQKYGSDLSGMLKGKTLLDFKQMKSVEKYTSKIQIDDKVYDYIKILDNPQEKLVSTGKEKINQGVKEVDQAFKNKYDTNVNISDVANAEKKKAAAEQMKYKADFSRYALLDSEKSFYNTFNEVFIGNNTLAACKAANGSKVLKAEPSLSGLVVTEGNGLIKMNVYKEDLNKKHELMANVYQNDNNIITEVRNPKGDLRWREPGSLEIQKVPTGDVAYVFNKTTLKGKWVQAKTGQNFDEISQFSFYAEQQLSDDKKRFEEKREQLIKEAENAGIKGTIKKEAKKKAEEEISKKIGNKIKLDNFFKKGGKKKWF